MKETKRQMKTLRCNIKKYHKLKEKIKNLEAQAKELNATIKSFMSELSLDKIETENLRATYYSSFRSNFLSEDFKKDHPELYSQYSYSTNYTHLKVSIIEV